MTKWLPLFAAPLLLFGCDRAPDPAAVEEAYEPAIAGLDRSQAGKAAPSTTFFNPAGEPVTMADFQGRPVLVNLWATWCAPCVKELPTLDTLAGELGDEVAVVTLSQDMAKRETVVAFLEKLGVENLAAWQDDEMAFGLEVGANILPTTILYDSAGKEIWRYVGDADWTSDEAIALINEAN